MSEYNEGDLIEAEKKEIASSTRLRGVVKKWEGEAGTELIVKAPGYEPMISWLEEQGFTLTVIEKAKPKLPTEWGAYTDCDGDMWVLDRNGLWIDFSSGEQVLDPVRYAPFSKLEPASDTAKKVLDALRERVVFGTVVPSDLDQIAAEFGVAK